MSGKAPDMWHPVFGDDSEARLTAAPTGGDDVRFLTRAGARVRNDTCRVLLSAWLKLRPDTNLRGRGQPAPYEIYLPNLAIITPMMVPPMAPMPMIGA